MIKNWRLTSDVVLMVENTGSGNKLYIASPEKKQYEVAVSKLCRDRYATETIENTDFDIRLGQGGEHYSPTVYIKTSQLPELGWAEIVNFYTPSIWNILKQCKTECGDIIGKFKITFTESDPKLVSLVSPDMTEYKEAQEEMKRRLRCEIGRKTRSLKPGHRYDSLKETRYYLCSIVSRKSSKCSSDFQNDSLTRSTPGYIYTNMILDSDSSVSDVLKNRKFGTGPYDLKVAISENTSWIDSGVKLKDDFTGNIKDYWEDIVTNTSKAGEYIVKESSYKTYSNFADIFEVFSCQSESNLDYKISSTLMKKISDVIDNVLEYTFLKYWKLRHPDPNLEINDKKELDKNADALNKIFYSLINDGNIKKFSYYMSLFNTLGINLRKASEHMIAGFSEYDLTDSFENYLKYKFFWKNKKSIYSSTKPILDYTIDKIKNTSDDIENLFGRSDLSKVIKDLYYYADTNFGDGVKEYIVHSSFDKADKSKYVFCCITLDDIVKFKKGVSEMSENLKNEIILNKFDSIIIKCKKSDAI